ncbi:MAG TPA: DUF4397 domain-containing protein [Gemmatimonadales bacterium]
MRTGYYAGYLGAVAATIVTSVTGRIERGPRRLDAEVRFTNHLPATRNWSLAANGVVLFADVHSQTTTAYSAVSDTTTRLTLVARAGDSATTSTTYQFVAGSYYTVTATYGNGDRPELAVERDRPPADTMPEKGRRH